MRGSWSARYILLMPDTWLRVVGIAPFVDSSFSADGPKTLHKVELPVYNFYKHCFGRPQNGTEDSRSFKWSPELSADFVRGEKSDGATEMTRLKMYVLLDRQAP